MSLDDADFIVELLNDSAFLRFVGDKGVRTSDDARNYILTGLLESYARHGFGLWVVELKGSGRSMGICGLLKREALDHVDIGFAFYLSTGLEGMPSSRLPPSWTTPEPFSASGGSWPSQMTTTRAPNESWKRSA